MPAKTDIAIVLATSGVAIEAIALGFLGVLYAVYAQFAVPDEQGRRMPVLGPLRTMARLVAIFTASNAVTTGLAVWWLLNPEDALFNAA
jgi:hypothetical protein